MTSDGTDQSTGGMKCAACEEEHTDWRKDGEHYINSYHHSGVAEEYECGSCGEIQEVLRK